MKKLLTFLFIGGAATLLQFFILTVLIETDLLSETPASAVSYAISAVFNYLANYYFTFSIARPNFTVSNSEGLSVAEHGTNLAQNKSHRHSKTFPKFVATAAIGLALNTVLFKVALIFLQNHLPAHSNLLDTAYLFAQLFATLLTLIVNFLLHKFWIYRR